MILYIRLLKESFAFAFNALISNKLRTFLSLLGVTVGIFSIIAVLAAVDSLKKNIVDSLDGMDKNTIYLFKYSFGPTEVEKWKRDQFPQVKYDEYQYLQKSMPDIDKISFNFFTKNLYEWLDKFELKFYLLYAQAKNETKLLLVAQNF